MYCKIITYYKQLLEEEISPCLQKNVLLQRCLRVKKILSHVNDNESFNETFDLTGELSLQWQKLQVLKAVALE